MHIALVAWGLPPCRGSGVYRPLAMINQLTEMGHEVTAITAGRATFTAFYGADESLEACVPQSARMHRISFAPEVEWPLVNDWTAERVHEPKRWRQSVLANHLRKYPERVYAPWLDPASQGLIALHNERAVDLVLATGNPYVDFEIAHRLYQLEGVPFVLDDRDSFLFVTYSGERNPLYESRLTYFTQYATSALEYWSVNPPLTLLHQSAAAGNETPFRTVENGWDADVILRPRSGPRPPREKLRFGFVGNITPYLPVEEMLQNWCAFLSSTRSDAEFHLFGQFGFTNDPGSRGRKQADVIRRTPSVRLRGRVPRSSLANEYADLDALVFVAPGGSNITAGKVYEYVATGLPIVALGAEGQDAMRVLGGYPRLHSAQLDDELAAVEAFCGAVSDVRSGEAGAAADAAREYARQYRRDRVLRPALARIIEKAS